MHWIGKLSTEFPVFTGHGGPVIDTQFSPFDDHIIASGAEDSKVMLWRIPEDLEDESQLGQVYNDPLLTLDKHGRQVNNASNYGQKRQENKQSRLYLMITYPIL